MRRALRYIGLLVTVTPLLTVCALGYLALSETAGGWLLQQVVSRVPGDLRIASTSGRLVSGVVLRDVTYRQDKRLELQAGEIRLRWRPAALLHGTLRIETLHVRDALYRDLAPPRQDDTPFTLPERIALPLGIALDDAEITGLHIETPDQQLFIDETTLSARAGPIKGLVIERFTIRTADSSAQLTGKTALHRPYAFACETNWRTRLPDAPDAAGSARLDGDMDRVRVDHTLSLPFQVTTRGTVLLDDETPVFRLAGQWRSLQWPLSGTALYSSDQGDYAVDGTLDDYRFQLHGAVAGQDIPDLLVQASGQGDKQHVRLEPLDIDALGGTLSGRGDLSWSPQFSLGLDVRAADIDPGRHWSGWPGRLHGTTRLAVQTQDESTLVELSEIDLSGTLREYPLTARGDLTVRDGVPGFRGLVLSSGSNRIELAGVLDNRQGIRYHIDAPELAALFPQAGGALVAEGKLTGPVEKPGGTVNLTATGLSHGDNSAASLHIRAHLDRAHPDSAEAIVEAEDLRLGDTHIDRLKLENRGWIEAHRTDLRLSSAWGDADIDVQGGYSEGVWQGRLGTATFDLSQYGSWSLREAVALRITAERLDPFRACWDSEQRELCLQGERRNDTLTMALAGHAAEGRLQADLKIAQLSSERPILGGEISLHIPDIHFLDPLIPDASVVSGAVTARARLAGHPDAPAITGTAALEQGLVQVPVLGLEVTQIGLQASADGERVELAGSARSGDGEIRFSGTGGLDPAQGWPFEISLTGERFAIARLPDIDIVANPDLKIAGSSGLVDISGSVFIPHAQIRLKRLPPDTVKVSADQIIVG
ncbi:MAG: translocation/assembly module TamB domain-containing protein, partial [Thiogranum sp.]